MLHAYRCTHCERPYTHSGELPENAPCLDKLCTGVLAKDNVFVNGLSNLRPPHYKEGEDTFAWAEKTFELDTCLAIAAFNIHKYNSRDKGQDYDDFGKISDYALWARRMMVKSNG